MRSAFAVRFTQNGKLVRKGEKTCAATHRSQHSCSPECAFYDSGCYAEVGRQGIHTARLNLSSERDVLAIAREHAMAIDELPGDTPLRVDIVGDDRTPESAAITSAAVDRYVARYGSPVWKYTHSWRAIPRNSWGANLSILASCETLDDVEMAHNGGYASAIVVGAFSGEKAYEIGRGFTGIPCPAQTTAKRKCIECRLCFRADTLHTRKSVILFEAMGTNASAARESLLQIGGM